MMSLCHCHSVGIAMATGWAQAPTQPHIHPAPYTHLQELAVAVVTEAVRGSGRREGINVWERLHHHLWVLQWADVSPIQAACIYLRFMSQRVKRSREKPSPLRIHLLKSIYATVKNAICKRSSIQSATATLTLISTQLNNSHWGQNTKRRKVDTLNNSSCCISHLVKWQRSSTQERC